MSDSEDTTKYAVVINAEEQYSIWPADREVPAGVEAGGHDGAQGRVHGAHQGSLDGYAPPLSLRRHMEAAAAQDHD